MHHCLWHGQNRWDYGTNPGPRNRLRYSRLHQFTALAGDLRVSPGPEDKDI